MLVRDLRRRITLLSGNEGEDAELAELLSALLTKIDAHDGMSIQDLIRRITASAIPKKKRARASAEGAAVTDVASLVTRLRASFSDDAQFDRIMQELRSQRSVTKPVLTQIFMALFERQRGVPKSATRAELLRLIADERHIIVRNEKSGRRIQAE